MKDRKKSKQGNPNRPRSRNNPNGVRQDPPFDYKKYEQNRKAEPDKYANYMKTITRKVRRLLDVPDGKFNIYICAILALIIKIRRKLDYRGLSCYFKENSEELRRCEMRKAYGKPRLQQIIADIKPKVLQNIIRWIANTDANKELHIDSSGFGLKIYTEWKHAKYGKILACIVTECKEHDSPQLRELLKQIPEYSGCDDVYFLGDAAYNSRENCQAVRESGRIPIMAPNKGQSPKGFNAWSKMLRFLDEHPRYVLWYTASP